MPKLICPVCGEVLTEEPRLCRCKNGHSFDRAASGYVNLLIAKQNGKIHGDDKAMVRARRDFLDAGYYEPLRRALCTEILNHADSGKLSLLDAGCGECWYTSEIKRTLEEAGIRADTVGIDISKEALKLGGKRDRSLRLAVASAYRLPVADESCDVITNVFAPFAGEEYLRCLRSGGILLHVSPDERHLWELKEAVYERPYLNDAAPPVQEGLELCREQNLKFRINIEKNSEIKALFMMTPYAHKTSPEDMARLDSMEKLLVEAEFIIRTYKKS